MTVKSGKIVIIVAPSGTGKSTLIKRLMQECKEISWSVSYTTRPMREGEKEGVDYFFINEEDAWRYRNAPLFAHVSVIIVKGVEAIAMLMLVGLNVGICARRERDADDLIVAFFGERAYRGRCGFANGAPASPKVHQCGSFTVINLLAAIVLGLAVDDQLRGVTLGHVALLVLGDHNHHQGNHG